MRTLCIFTLAKWKLASRTSVATINGSVGGGMWSVLYSYCLTKKYNGKLDVGEFTTGILAGLVSITAICAVCRPWEALLIGFIGGILASYSKCVSKDIILVLLPLLLF